jgi:transforming growth factor-beta-induced protein
MRTHYDLRLPLTLVAAGLAACGSEETTQNPGPTPPAQPGTIAQVAAADGRFGTLVQALTAAELVDTLSGPGPFTVFAPTDDAFAALPAGALDALLADREALTRVLTYHVVSGRVDAATVVTLSSATTVQGDDVAIEVRGSEVFVNQAKVIITDVPASNGLIHVIDAVLTPPEPAPGTIVDVAIADGRFTTLVAAVQAAGLADTLSGPGPFTVFAPTDDAFAALPAGTVEALLADPAALARVLTYHVVSGAVDAATVVGLDVATTVQGGPVFVRIEGGEVRINDARVIITDVPASNGIIHVIDAVLLPPAGSIADIVTSRAEFSTLATAVTTAGLAATLDGPGPFTVFAPTNDAFALIPAATLQGLLADTAALSNVLLYHVVPGIVPAAEVVTLSSATTAQGGALSIQVDAGVVRVGSAQVMVTDIPADNGIIHVIDAVLIP